MMLIVTSGVMVKQLYMIYKEYVSRDKSLTSDHEIRLDPFKVLFFGATQVAFWNKQTL